MKRYDENELQTLRDRYIDAAVSLVAEQGWSSLSLRNIGRRVGKSQTSIHRQFSESALQSEVIETAFAHLALAVELFQSVPCPSPAEMHLSIVDYLRRTKEAAALMVQVAALAAAKGADDAEAASSAIVRARTRTTLDIAHMLGSLHPYLQQSALEMRADALLEWYVAVCVALIITPLVSTPDLVRLASRQSTLCDRCNERAKAGSTQV
jgi:AcrR family transcriptional regulator